MTDALAATMTEIQRLRLKKVLAEATALARELRDGGLKISLRTRTLFDDCEEWPEVVAEVTSLRSVTLTPGTI